MAQGPRLLRAARARVGTFLLLDIHVGLTSALKVSRHHRHQHRCQHIRHGLFATHHSGASCALARKEPDQ